MNSCSIVGEISLYTCDSCYINQVLLLYYQGLYVLSESKSLNLNNIKFLLIKFDGETTI